ncbi:MAG: glycosyltransferase family 2 protein [Treponema sp.]|nr:glycosyltransferase family 2 protein [Treponema sp.]
MIKNEILYIVLPAYNEEENIESVVRSWYAILSGKDEESRIVVADSKSKDKTHEKLLALQKEFPKLEILNETGQYHGEKVIALYDYAIKNGANWIFQTDADGQTNPAEFAAFWEIRNEYDGIFGNRTVRGDGKSRAFVEKVVCFLLRIYFGVKVPDANAPFRLMKAEIVAKYLPRFDKDYNLPNIMMTTYFVFYDERRTFREISFRPRQGGVNSINIPRIIKIGWKALGDFRKLKKGMKK